MLDVLRLPYRHCQLWLESRRRVWGVLRYKVYIGLAAFGLGFDLVGYLLFHLLIPDDAVFVVGGTAISGASLRLQLLLMYASVLALMAAVIYLHLVKMLIIPMERMQHRLRPRADPMDEPPTERFDEQREEMDLLRIMVHNAQEQATAQESRSIGLEAELERLHRQLAGEQERHLAFVGSSSDSSLELDAGGRVVAATPAAAALLRLPPNRLIGAPLQEIATLYDGAQLEPREHPLIGRLLQAIADGNSTPRIDQALLCDAEGAETEVLSTLLPGRVGTMPAILRLQPAGERQVSPDGSVALLESGVALPNHQAFRRRAGELIVRCRQSDQHHAFALFVVKGVRDEDDPTEYFRNEVAAAVGRNLRRSLEGTADVFRLGVVAFAVLARNSGLRACEDLFETARALAQLDAARLASGGMSLRVQYGAGEISRASSTVDQLLADAVSQLTELAIGPSRDTRAAASDAGGWADWIAGKLAGERLRLVSQSVVPTLDDSTIRPWLEVFVRIEDDDGHWLEPQHFLRAIEHAREVDRLDAAVLERILATCRGRDDIWGRYEGISVNVSVQSLCSDRYLSRAVELVREYGIEPGRLAVELDQGVRSEDINRALPGIELLAGAGIRLIIDGCTDTRVLRLARLLRPAMVKLSPDLIAAARVDPVAEAELEALLRTAKLLGARLSAKNVDDAGDAPRLAALGIELQQGRGIESMGPLMH